MSGTLLLIPEKWEFIKVESIITMRNLHFSQISSTFVFTNKVHQFPLKKFRYRRVEYFCRSILLNKNSVNANIYANIIINIPGAFMSCIKFLFLSLISVSLFSSPVNKEQVFKLEENKPIHLNFNENPFGPSPMVKTSMLKTYQSTSLYPDDEENAFLRELASYHSVSESELLVSNGLASILSITADTFLTDQNSLILGDPTFDVIATYAKERGAKIIKVPLKEDFSHDLDGMLKKIDSRAKLIYICNPNNPTGAITPRVEIENFLKKLPPDVYLFVDEAYHHFAEESPGYVSFIEKPIKDDRLIVGRTFSKVYGLAGVRLAYAFSTPITIEKLKKKTVMDSNNIVALSAGRAALKDDAAMVAMVRKIKEVKEAFYEQADARGISYIPTHGNFIMMETDERSVQSVLDHFKKHHILLGREFPPMHTHIRISFGLPEEMAKFWEVWDQLPKQTR